MRKNIEKYIVITCLCMNFLFIFFGKKVYAEESFILPVEHIEILFDIMDEDHCRQKVRFFFSNDVIAGEEELLSDFMNKKFEEIYVAGLSMEYNPMQDSTTYFFNRGYVSLDGCDRFLNEIFGKGTASIIVENKSEELAPFISGNQLLLDVDLPDWVQSEDGGAIPVSFGIGHTDNYKYFVADSYVDIKDRSTVGSKRDESGIYDIIYTADYTGKTIHLPLWILDENSVKEIDVELVQEEEGWRRTNDFSFYRQPSENATEKMEEYFREKASALDAVNRETWVGVAGEWDEGVYHLIITQTGDEQILQKSSELLFGSEKGLTHERESGIWKIKKKEYYKNNIDYSDILDQAPTGFHITFSIPVSKSSICNNCNYDTITIADGLLQISTNEKYIDLDYEGTVTDYVAVALWEAVGIVVLACVCILFMLLIRNPRRRKGTGEKQAFFCPNCGSLIKADSTICKKCGNKIFQ